MLTVEAFLRDRDEILSSLQCKKLCPNVNYFVRPILRVNCPKNIVLAHAKLLIFECNLLGGVI